MLKFLALSLSLAIATTAATAAISPKSDAFISLSTLVSNAAAKADRLDVRSNKADRLEGVSAKSDRLSPAQTLDASLLIAGALKIASSN